MGWGGEGSGDGLVESMNFKSSRDHTGHEWPLTLAGLKRIAITLADMVTISHSEVTPMEQL